MAIRLRDRDSQRLLEVIFQRNKEEEYMKNVYLIANAHLDPVWLWRWEEGYAEALSTFRTAAELTDDYPGFI